MFNERYRLLCKSLQKNIIETEYHFVVKCNLYIDSRTKYLNYVKNYSIMHYTVFTQFNDALELTTPSN